ncbi:MAG: hypothetical protein H6Q67_2426 [Firmicutes bacterium]|nr:hypothetical protein [Bacillota bacterium]
MLYKITVNVKHPMGAFEYAFPMDGDDKSILTKQAIQHSSKAHNVLPRSIKVKKIEAM